MSKPIFRKQLAPALIVLALMALLAPCFAYAAEAEQEQPEVLAAAEEPTLETEVTGEEEVPEALEAPAETYDLSQAVMDPVNDYVYTGSPKQPKPKVTLTVGGKDIPLIYEGENANCEYDWPNGGYTPISPGTYKVRLKAKEGSNLTGSITGTFNIVPVDLSGYPADRTLSYWPWLYQRMEYDGTRKTPEFVVVQNLCQIHPTSTTYKRTYENNINAGKAGEPGCPAAVFTGLGKYFVGTMRVEFTIHPMPVTSDKLTYSKVSDCDWTGSPIKPAIEIKHGRTVLVEGKDYTIEYGNKNNPENKDAGKATIVVKGMGNFESSKKIDFYIKGDFSKAVAASIPEQAFNGEELTPPVTLTYNGKKMVEGEDYTVEYVNNTAPGTATAKITGIGAFEGTKELTFTIKPIDISKATVAAVKDKTYNGQAFEPKPKLTLGGKTLKPDVDYSLSYKDNVNRGTATITATGKGGYSGTASITFKILPAWTRLYGSNALGTMEKVVAEFGSASAAVVTGSSDFRGTLAASALAGSLDAPIITTSSKGLSAQAKNALASCGASAIYIVGSDKDVPAAVEAEIRALAGVRTVKRISAASASAKAIECAKGVGVKLSNTVIIATQKSYKDALSVSSYAYASGSPVLYTESKLTLSKDTLAFIKAAGFTRAIIVGGPIAVPASVEDQLAGAGIAKGSITRLAGANAYRTSRVIAEWAQGKLKNGTGGGSGVYEYANVRFQPAVKLSANKLGVARGDGWADALTGSALCGRNRSILLLGDSHSTSNTTVVKKAKEQISQGYVFGGPLAVSDEVYAKFEAASK